MDNKPEIYAAIRLFIKERKWPEARTALASLNPTEMEKAAFNARLYSMLQEEAMLTVGKVFFD